MVYVNGSTSQSTKSIIKRRSGKKFTQHQEQLQSDLDDWINQYTIERPHFGKICRGRTPMQTFFESLDMAKNKMLDNLYSVDINAAA
jgi:hypothetical protein